MLQLSPQSKIFLCIQAADGRKGIDGLAALCRQKLEQDPICGAFFVFSNKRRVTIKILCYDGQGFWLLIKRLSSGRFKWWPKEQGELATINYREFYTFIHNGIPSAAKFGLDWKPIP